MPITELNDERHEITIDADTRVDLDSPLLASLLLNLELLSTQIKGGGLKELNTSKAGTTVSYSFETVDNRIWNQTFVFNQFPDPNPLQTFDISDGFRLSEFEPHRIVRGIIIELYNKFGLNSMTLSIS